MHSCCETN